MSFYKSPWIKGTDTEFQIYLFIYVGLLMTTEDLNNWSWVESTLQYVSQHRQN